MDARTKKTTKLMKNYKAQEYMMGHEGIRQIRLHVLSDVIVLIKVHIRMIALVSEAVHETVIAYLNEDQVTASSIKTQSLC